MTSASQKMGTAGNIDAMRSEAEAAYQSCLKEWGLDEEEDDTPEE